VAQLVYHTHAVCDDWLKRRSVGVASALAVRVAILLQNSSHHHGSRLPMPVSVKSWTRQTPENLKDQRHKVQGNFR